MTPTPKIAGNEEDDLVISPIKISTDENLQIIPKPAQARQNAPTSASSNVQNNRAYGHGSSSGYRAPDASTMVNRLHSFSSNYTW